MTILGIDELQEYAKQYKSGEDLSREQTGNLIDTVSYLIESEIVSVFKNAKTDCFAMVNAYFEKHADFEYEVRMHAGHKGLHHLEIICEDNENLITVDKIEKLLCDMNFEKYELPHEITSGNVT